METDRAELVEKLAMIFCDHLIDDIGADGMEELVKRFDSEKDPCVCHSYDFCDANMTMLSAFERVTGREEVATSDADVELVNAAWNKAKENRYYW